MQGQHASPGGPLNNARFRATIVVGQIHNSQQLNLIHYKALPGKCAVLLSTHLTICVQCALIYLEVLSKFLIHIAEHLCPPLREECDKELIFLTGPFGCVVRDRWHTEVGGEYNQEEEN